MQLFLTEIHPGDRVGTSALCIKWGPKIRVLSSSATAIPLWKSYHLAGGENFFCNFLDIPTKVSMPSKMTKTSTTPHRAIQQIKLSAVQFDLRKARNIFSPNSPAISVKVLDEKCSQGSSDELKKYVHISFNTPTKFSLQAIPPEERFCQWKGVFAMKNKTRLVLSFCN